VKKVFLFNSIILLLTNFVVRPLYLFGVEMKIQNTVGAEEYGLYFLVFDFVFFLPSMIQDFRHILPEFYQPREVSSKIYSGVF